MNSPPIESATPEVSVVLRTRNRPNLLREALGSVATQSFRDFEVVVVNDGGQDVGAVLAEFAGIAIVPIVLPESRGRGAASNAGVAAARGRFVGYLDDDDLYEAEHLETLHGFLAAHEHFGAAYANAAVGRYVLDPESLRYRRIARSVEHDQDFDAELLLYQNFVPNLCLMHRRELWERAGRFDESLDVLEDWEFLIRLAGQCSIQHVRRCTAEYRIRNDGTNLSSQKPWGGVEEANVRTEIFRRHWHRRSPEVERRVYDRLQREVWQSRDEARQSAEVASANAALVARNDELSRRHDELERAATEAAERARRDRERAELLEREVESVSTELLEANRALRDLRARLEQASSRVDGELLDRLHREVASRQSLIDSMRSTKLWRFREILRKVNGGG